MKKFFVLLLLLGAFFFYIYQSNDSKKILIKEEDQKFAILIYAHNQVDFCERAIQSVFEQDYEKFRVVFIDDASIDQTFEKAYLFARENNLDSKISFLQNSKYLGPYFTLFQVKDLFFDDEVIFTMSAGDFFCFSDVLQKQNEIYKNPDVWMSIGASVDYPTYVFQPKSAFSFSSILLKTIPLADFTKRGLFANVFQSAKEHFVESDQPILFNNFASNSAIKEPLNFENFSQSDSVNNLDTDIVIFSFDKPLQLYSCLESIQRYVSNYRSIFVIYRVSDDSYDKAYDEIKKTFSDVRFLAQKKGKKVKESFKPLVLKAFKDPSSFVLFADDDLLVKDFVDLKLCVSWMNKTHAHGFYLGLAEHIDYFFKDSKKQQTPGFIRLGDDVLAWDIKNAECDWGLENSLNMTIYRKQDIIKAFEKMRYNSPKHLKSRWSRKFSLDDAIGICFSTSKALKLSIESQNNSSISMNSNLQFELLKRFNENLKINIDPLYKTENHSIECVYNPEFITR